VEFVLETYRNKNRSDSLKNVVKRNLLRLTPRTEMKTWTRYWCLTIDEET